MRLILENAEIKYEPAFSDFEVVLLNVYDVMIKAVGVVPRVETKLYSEWVRYATSRGVTSRAPVLRCVVGLSCVL